MPEPRDALIDRLSRRRDEPAAPAERAPLLCRCGDRHGHGRAVRDARRRRFPAGAERRPDAQHGRAVDRGHAAAAGDQRPGHELRAPGDPAARERAGVLRRGLVPSRPRPRRAGRRDRRGRLLRHREFPDRDPDRRRLSAVPRGRRARLQSRARAARDRQGAAASRRSPTRTPWTRRAPPPSAASTWSTSISAGTWAACSASIPICGSRRPR